MAERPLSVLVLGVGGNVSQGILKALAISSLPLRVVAGCISPLSVGRYHSALALVSPRADEPDFVPWVEATCAAERIDAVLSGSEPVIEAVAPAADRIRAATGAVCLVSPPEVGEIGQDKLRTAYWLEEAGLPHPRSVSAADGAAVEALVEAIGLPVVAKPRRGRSGEGVVVARTREELAPHVGRADELIQEHLPGDEYTVGCMTDADGRLRGSIAMRRELSVGTTVSAEIGDLPEARSYAAAIAEALHPRGPLNVQLRLRDAQPVAFELNVRFSGTTPMRARAGFNEVEAALRHFVLGEPMSLPTVTSGTVLRYWNELYVPERAREALEKRGRLDDPWSEDVVVEDWGTRG